MKKQKIRVGATMIGMLISFMITAPFLYRTTILIKTSIDYQPVSFDPAEDEPGKTIETVMYLNGHNLDDQLRFIKESYTGLGHMRFIRKIIDVTIPYPLRSKDCDGRIVQISSLDEKSFKYYLTKSPFLRNDHIQIIKTVPIFFKLLKPSRKSGEESEYYTVLKIEVKEGPNDTCIKGDTLFQDQTLKEPNLGYDNMSLPKSYQNSLNGPKLSYSTLPQGTPIWGVFELEKTKPLTIRCQKIIDINHPNELWRRYLRHDVFSFDDIILWLLSILGLLGGGYSTYRFYMHLTIGRSLD